MPQHTPNTAIKQHGQILLITILILTVAVTIALSLIGRATTDLSISNQLEDSTRAFNAAEAGVEQTLQSGSGTSGPTVLTPGVTYDVQVTDIGGGGGVYQLPHETPQDMTETIWLVEHDQTTKELIETPYFTETSLDLCWSTSAVPAALVVSVLYKEGTDNTYKAARMAIDPDAASRGNNFDASGITTNGCGLSYYRKVITFSNLGISVANPNRDTLLAIRVRPEYEDTTIAVSSSGGGFPSQGNQITSTGSTASGVSRKVMVYQQYRAPLSIFDNVIYSQSSFGH